MNSRKLGLKGNKQLGLRGRELKHNQAIYQLKIYIKYHHD